jgi:hypothetical protein
VLRKIDEPKWEEAAWAGHAARMGRKINAYTVVVGKREGKRPFGVDLGVDRKIIFKRISKK